MAVFFLVVGLEIGRERRTGRSGRHLRTAVVPVAGAAGGMAGAGLVYALFNHGGAGSSGWGIPMATDIAFALGALALLGRRVPPGLRLLLLTLAVADDIGSVAVLAVFYSARTRPRRPWSGAAAGRGRPGGSPAAAPPRRGWPFLLGGVGLWVLLAAGGVEPALAGVVVGLLVPARRRAATGSRPSASSARWPRSRRSWCSRSSRWPMPGSPSTRGCCPPPGAASVFFGVAWPGWSASWWASRWPVWWWCASASGRLPEGCGGATWPAGPPWPASASRCRCSSPS